MRVDELPLETFDAITRFAIFWLRAKGRAEVPKGEARFFAQADELRLDELRGASSASRPLGWVGGVASVPVTAAVQPVIKHKRRGQGGRPGPHAGSWHGACVEIDSWQRPCGLVWCDDREHGVCCRSGRRCRGSRGGGPPCRRSCLHRRAAARRGTGRRASGSRLALRPPPVEPGAGPALIRMNFGVIALIVATR